MSGYTVYTACNGKDALKQAGCQPDLVLLDINMPDMDGLTVCETLRQYIACPVLFLTARVETADKIRGFQAGADDYISPFRNEQYRNQGNKATEKRNRYQKVIIFLPRDVEQRFLNSPTDSMAIYQLRRDAPVELRFASLGSLAAPPDPTNYEAIYTREVYPDDDTGRILENFYYMQKSAT